MGIEWDDDSGNLEWDDDSRKLGDEKPKDDPSRNIDLSMLRFERRRRSQNLAVIQVELPQVGLSQRALTGRCPGIDRAFTGRCQGAAVSLEIPRIVVSFEIPEFPDFFHKKSGKIVNIGFLTPGTKMNFWNFWTFSKILYMASMPYMNHYFRAPSPLKPWKSRPQSQNLPGFPIIAHSDHREPVSAQFYGLSCLRLTLS